MSSDLVHINFCRPIINNKVEERTCGNGPNLADIFEDDAEIINVAQSVHVRERRREGGEGEDIGEIEGEREGGRESELLYHYSHCRMFYYQASVWLMIMPASLSCLESFMKRMRILTSRTLKMETMVLKTYTEIT